MPYLATAVFLVFLSNAVAVAVTYSLDISKYFDIMEICDRLGTSPLSCQAHALSAGLVSCGASIITAVLLVAATRRNPPVADRRAVGIDGCVLVGAIVLFITLYNVAFESVTPLPFAREEAFWHRATAVSIGNLVWPLCIQLANQARTFRLRLAFLSLTAPIAIFSPFRGVVFAIATFGIVVPILMSGASIVRKGGNYRRQFITLIAVVGMVVGVLTIHIFVDSAERTSNLNLSGETVASQLSEKLAQRVSIPVFQSYLASALEIETDLPSILDEIAAKLRIGHAPSINKYLFSKSEPISPQAGGTLGETTSGMYGEAALRSASFPIIWVVVAPWILILAWGGFQRHGLETSTLFGLAIWRASLSGVVSILPALAVQLAVLWALSRWTSSRGETP